MSVFTQNKAKSLTFILGAALTAGLGSVMIGAGADQEGSMQDATATVGQQAPDFTLTDYTGKEHKLSDYTKEGKTVVLEWFNPECPFVKKHYREDTGTMLQIQEDMKDEPVVWLLVNSGRKGHPTTGVDVNKEIAQEWNITAPILLDETGRVGKAYQAKRTPEMYIINDRGVLTYHGAIDNRPDAAAPGDVNYVRNALQQTLAGETVTTPTTKAYGCGVKY